MGGRGAASGMSIFKNPYGSQYHTVLQDENIKFVEKNTRNSETLMETMTEGRIYVMVGGKDLLRIIQFDENNKRNHVIERDKKTDTWHVHNGYYHIEYGEKRHEEPNASDKLLIDKVTKLWDNKKGI